MPAPNWATGALCPPTRRSYQAELDERDLKLLASWVSVKLHDPASHAASEADAVRTARQLAQVGGPNNLIVLGNDPYGDPMRTLMPGASRRTRA